MLNKTRKLATVALDKDNEAGAVIDGAPVITELGAGQIIGAWLRQIKYALVAGNPDRLVLPFHDFFVLEELEDEVEYSDAPVLTVKKNDDFGSMPEMKNKYAVVVSTHKGLVSSEDESFCKLAGNQMEAALTIVRQREARVRDQTLSLRKLRFACRNWDSLHDVHSLLSFVVKEVATVMLGTNVFINLVQPGGNEMKIAFTTDPEFSGLGTEREKDKTLNFQVVDGGYIYFALGGRVQRSHASWSSKIAQMSLPLCDIVDLQGVVAEGEEEDPEARKENVVGHKFSLKRSMAVTDDETTDGKVVKKELKSSQSATNVRANRMVGRNASSNLSSSSSKSLKEIQGKDYYWIVLRKNIKFAAREYALGYMRENPDDIEHLAHIGHLFVDSGPTATHKTHKFAALLLQKAADLGFEGHSKFWRELATSHMRTYLSAGLTGEREHLTYACAAWKKALTFLENTVNSNCWVSYAMSHSYLGDFKSASAALSQLISNFPNLKNTSNVLFESSTLMKRLRRFQQASDNLYNCLMRGKVCQPYKIEDLKFGLAHVLELWSKEVKDKDKLLQGKELYAEVYDAYFAGKSKLGRKKKIPTYDVWIHDYKTWCGFAETSSLGSDFVLASDYFKQSLKCIEKHNSLMTKNGDTKGMISEKSTGKVWFSLSKCQMRSGEDEIAKNSLGRAIMLDNSSVQMQSFMESWVSNESRFDTDLSLDVEKILTEVVTVRKSVMSAGFADDDGEDEDEDEGVDGHILCPIQGSTYGLGTMSVTNLTLFRPKTLRKSRRIPETKDERDMRGLEDGIVNYIKDVGRVVGLAMERLRKKELLNKLKEEGESVKRGKKVKVQDILGIGAQILREGIVWCTRVEVLQIIEVKDEKKQREEKEKQIDMMIMKRQAAGVVVDEEGGMEELLANVDLMEDSPDDSVVDLLGSKAIVRCVLGEDELWRAGEKGGGGGRWWREGGRRRRKGRRGGRRRGRAEG